MEKSGHKLKIFVSYVELSADASHTKNDRFRRFFPLTLTMFEFSHAISYPAKSWVPLVRSVQQVEEKGWYIMVVVTINLWLFSLITQSDCPDYLVSPSENIW